MVSLWPWKGDSTSAASFERTLSSLASKTSKASARNDNLRQRARRVRVVWTLYSSFAYILIALILTLVTGWRNWGPAEYTAVAGGPLVLYAVRRALTAYYNYRIANTQAHLDHLYKERDGTIEKLKAATKYNTTQQLLEKYGSKPAPVELPPSGGSKRRSGGGQKTETPGRTNIPPPPTANIPRINTLSSNPASPQRAPSGQHSPLRQPSVPYAVPDPTSPLASQAIEPTAEFAPNAYSSPPQYATGPNFGQPSWLDRIMETLMGEDETLPKNRFALICTHCRLVNGQAPPGTKSLEDLGKWRCGGCGGWNGEESETKKLVRYISEQARVQAGEDVETSGRSTSNGHTSDETEEAERVDAEDEKPTPGVSSSDVDRVNTPARSTRSKSKGKKKS